MRIAGIRLAAATALALLLTGCAGLGGGERQANLELQMLAHEKAIRWGEFQRAEAYRKPGAPATDLSRYVGVRVTGYEVQGMDFSADGNVLTQTVRIDYHFDDAVSVRRLLDRQVWEYEPESGRWYLTSGLPAFR